VLIAETSGLVVYGIEGLGPAKSNINVRENASASGSLFNSARTPSRNVVLTLGFLESPTIEAARLRTYRYFPNEGRIRLDVVTDAGTFYTYGYVESNEPNIFSSSQGCVISVICPDPFMRVANGAISGTIAAIAAMFSFPFSNEVGETELIFGERFFQSIDFNIPFAGNITVGPTLIITAEGGQVDNPRIYFYNQYDPTVVESLKFLFTESLPKLEDGDRLEIVCERQNKSVRRYVHATGQYMNYIGAVTIDSAWPILHAGNNLFSYEADSGGAYIRFSYEYELKYAGV
jgi:hypothetical protein